MHIAGYVKKNLALKGKIEIEYLTDGTVSKKNTVDLNDVEFFYGQ